MLALLPILANDATVLFTFYPPLKANSLYYLGLTLLVVGTWVVLLTFVRTYRAWRRGASDGTDTAGGLHGPGDDDDVDDRQPGNCR
ncbi:MAG: hypothetical protein KatS3mg061_3245 [Dehalococcoidia bacterium]|nr:MAG: hypothetical protein KatS3mg061_3245 [Dehalococcoidia bacterium]